MRTLSRQIRRFCTDRTSGAAELAHSAAEILAETERLGAGAAEMRRLRERLAAAHPAMGAVWNTVHASDPSAYVRRVATGQRRAVRAARRLLRRGARVVTLSYSSTVAHVLARKDLRVTVGESRPGNDGRRLAQRRAGQNLHTRVVPDATLMVVVGEADCALIGADALSRRWVVNKVGSHLLALACREHSVPLYVVADPSKVVPTTWPAPEYSSRRPFEAVPRRLITRVLDGVE